MTTMVDSRMSRSTGFIVLGATSCVGIAALILTYAALRLVSLLGDH